MNHAGDKRTEWAPGRCGSLGPTGDCQVSGELDGIVAIHALGASYRGLCPVKWFPSRSEPFGRRVLTMRNSLVIVD